MDQPRLVHDSRNIGKGEHPGLRVCQLTSKAGTVMRGTDGMRGNVGSLPTRGVGILSRAGAIANTMEAPVCSGTSSPSTRRARHDQ